MVVLLSAKSSSLNRIAELGLTGSFHFAETGEVEVDLDKVGSRHARVVKLGERVSSIEFAISGLSEEADLKLEFGVNRVEITRNHFGRMQLFWAQRGARTYFSTSAISLAQILKSPISSRGFYSYSCFSFIAAPLSPFEKIHALAAGSTISFTRDVSAELQLKESSNVPWTESVRYTEPSSGLNSELRGLLLGAIEKQCADLAGRKTAIFLSGGLDSALTAALLKKIGCDLTAYSLDFGEFGRSELPVAEEIARYLGIPMTAVRCSPSDVERSFRATVSRCDTVFGDGVTVPLNLLCQKAADDACEVVFNGEGGDQLFGGWTNKPLIASTVYGTDFLCNLEDDDAFFTKYMATFHKVYGAEGVAFNPKRLSEAVSDLHPFFKTAFDSSKSKTLLHFLRRANLLLKGAQNIQPRASNLALSHGLSLRTIFCDDDLANFTFALSPDLLLKGSCEKFILKQCAEEFLPAEFIWREKRGMGVPSTQWFLGPLWHFAGKYLNSGRLQHSGYWNKDIAELLALGQAHAAWQGRRIGEILWMILSWELWSSNLSSGNLSKYNSFWPPLLYLKVKKGVMEN